MKYMIIKKYGKMYRKLFTEKKHVLLFAPNTQ